MTSPTSNVNYTVATGASSNSVFIEKFFDRDPTSSDINYQIQQRWWNTATNNEWVLVGFSSAGGTIQAIWKAVQSASTLETLSDDVGTVVYPSSGNIQLVGHVNEQGSTKFSTVVAGASLVNINPMSSARWIVDPLGFNGTHTTISSALSSATSGDTIFILPGTYTENPNLKQGVNLCACDCDAQNNVIINGKCTFTAAGSVSISGIQLQTNSDYCLAVTGSEASGVLLNNCFINCSNNTGINVSSSGSPGVFLYNCQGSLGGSFAYHTVSSVCNFVYYNCYLPNGADSGVVSNNSAGLVSLYGTNFYAPISTSSTGSIVAERSFISGQLSGTVALTTAGTGFASVYNCFIVGASVAAVSVGSGTSVGLINCRIDSVAAHAITGSGTLNYSDLTFTNSSSSINTSTTSQYPNGLPFDVSNGGTGNSSQAAYSLVCGGTTTTGPFQAVDPVAAGQVLVSAGTSSLPVWGNQQTRILGSQVASNVSSVIFNQFNSSIYSNYILLITSYQPVTNSTDLILQISGDGINYITTGYLSGTTYFNYNSATANNTNSTTGMLLASALGNGGTPMDGVYYLMNMNAAGFPTLLGSSAGLWGGTFSNATVSAVYNTIVSGVISVRIMASSGNVSRGTFTLIGLLG